MDRIEFIRDVTFKMCDRDFDLDLVESTFADDFVHHGNGATADKAGYLARGREYRDQYASIDRPEFDELFAVDDRVVVAYTLNLHRQDGSSERLAVLAIWTVDDDEVTALREVDATAAYGPNRSTCAPLSGLNVDRFGARAPAPGGRSPRLSSAPRRPRRRSAPAELPRCRWSRRRRCPLQC